jgi:two-component system, chemotaxis family, chemotaxis protein CheY
MKYLLVDDSKMARKMTYKALQNVITEPFEVVQASNGLEAIKLYQEEEPDICFMDLTMPELDGFEATKQICDLDEDANIVVVSADIQEKSIEKAREAGAIGFIKKPIDVNNLRSMLEGLELL